MATLTEVPYEAVISRFQQQPPVDVSGLAEALGVNVYETDALEPHISGKLFRDPKNGGTQGFSILVRASDPYVRRRFTVAHEIAHFLLHRDGVGESITDDEWYRSGLGSPKEIEANRLAADILMPKLLVERYALLVSYDVPELARQFEVSRDAMRIRLEALSIAQNYNTGAAGA